MPTCVPGVLPHVLVFVPKTVNRATNADLAIEFVKPRSEIADEISRILLKEVEKTKYKPSQIVTAMRKEGYKRFTMQSHTELWKSMCARDTKKGYGVEILGGQWCWYETWLNCVRKHCQENKDRYT